MSRTQRIVAGEYKFNCKTRFVFHGNPQRRQWYTLTSEFCAKDGKTVLAICPFEYVAVYLNGSYAFRICERSYIFDPAFKTIDITDLVKTGINTISILYCSTGEPSRDGVAFEISSNGSIVLVSDENVLSGVYSPLKPGTPYLVEGGAGEEIYDARLEQDIDNYADENASVIGSSLIRTPVEKIHKSDIKLLQDNEKCPKTILNHGLFESVKGYHKLLCPDGSSSNTGYYFARMDKTGSNNVTVKFISGVKEAYYKGTTVSDGDILVADGSYICVFGTCPDVCLFGHDNSLSWSFVEKPANPLSRPFFPWNDLKKPVEKDDVPLMLSLGKTTESKTYEVSEKEPSFHSVLKTGLFSTSKGIVGFKDFCLDNKNIKRLSHPDIYYPLTINPHDDLLVYLFDWDNEQIGSFSFDATLPCGYNIRFDFFESIKNEGASLMSPRMTLTYTSKGGRQSYYSHVRRGFRYVLMTLEPCKEKVFVNSLSSIDMSYPISTEYGFSCSDEIMNEIFRMCDHSAECCTLDTYIDCPAYEQNPWTGDAYITSQINLNCFGEYEMSKSYHRLISESIEDGLQKVYRTNNPRYVNRKNLPCACFPTYPDGTIPIWSYMWMNSVYDHYMYTGDRQFLIDILPAIEESLRRSEIQLSSRDLLSIDGAWNLIEWADNDLLQCGEISANSMMLKHILDIYAKVERDIGKTELSEHYSDLSKRIKDAVNKYCWDEEAKAYTDMVRDEYGYGIYSDYFKKIGREPESYYDYLKYKKISVQTNTYACIFGIAEGDRKKAASRFAIDNLSSGTYVAGTPANNVKGEYGPDRAPNGYVHIGSPFFLHNAYQLLADEGRFDLILDSIKRDYGSMLDDGIRTTTETFNKPGESNSRSYCHSWSAYPAAYFKRFVLGINPTKPGFEKFSLIPHLSGLEFAEGSVPTPYGEISVRITKDKIEYTCPKECQITDSSV